jgi:hypothetical protein
MLLPDSVHPEGTVYYNASFVLKALLEHRAMPLVDLYLLTRELRPISMPVFVLCVDWLFILDVVEMDRDGRVALCS